MNDVNFKALIKEHSHPHLAQETGMVHQVWGDGEVTLTKSGDLLGQRGLHMVERPITPEIWAEELLCKSGDNTFIYTDRKGAEAVRRAIYDRYKMFQDSLVK